MKKLTTKLMLALTVLGFAGGTAFTPLTQTAAAETVASRVYIGQVDTYHERSVDKNGNVRYDFWGGTQEVRCAHGFDLYLINHTITRLNDGGYLEQWLYGVRTY